jgi:hypothetical protein
MPADGKFRIPSFWMGSKASRVSTRSQAGMKGEGAFLLRFPGDPVSTLGERTFGLSPTVCAPGRLYFRPKGAGSEACEPPDTV